MTVFWDARSRVQTSIFWKLQHHNIPLAVELSFWCTYPKTIGVWIIGALTKLGVLTFP